MLNHPPFFSASRFPRKSGFALIISLTLMGFLVLLMVGLSSLVRVELHTSTTANLQLQARQNALLGLQVALGELQKNAGQDQRVTARADITDENAPNAYWTGVWKSTPPVTIDDEPRPVPPLNAGPTTNADNHLNPSESVLINWLVSGNEGLDLSSAGGNPRFDPLNALAADFGQDAGTPGVYLLGASTLIGPGADLTASVGLPGAVVAPKVEIKNADNATGGHYAWWVGDEGVKARVRVQETPSAIGKDASENTILAFQVPAASDPASMTDLGFFDRANATLDKVYDYGSLAIATGADLANRTALNNRWHDLTTVSSGLLTDTRWGGFRGDLTLAFENSGVFSRYFNTGDDTYYFVDVDELGYDAQFPNWEILQSFYNLKSSIYSNGTVRSQIAISANGSREVNPRETSVPYRQGDSNEGYHKNSPVTPILARTQVTIGLNYEPTGDTDPGDGRPWYTPAVLVKPLTGLYNPYNVAIARADGSSGTRSFQIRWSLLPAITIKVIEVDPDTGVETEKVGPGNLTANGVTFRLREVLTDQGTSEDKVASDMVFQHTNMTLAPGQTRLYGLWDNIDRTTFENNSRRIIMTTNQGSYDPMDGFLRLPLETAWEASSDGDTIYDFDGDKANGDHKFGLTTAEKDYLRVKDSDRVTVSYNAFAGGNVSSFWLKYNADHKDAPGKSTIQYFSPLGRSNNLLSTAPAQDFYVNRATSTSAAQTNLFTWGFWLRGTNEAHARDRLLADHNIRSVGTPQTWDAISADFYMSSVFTGDLEGAQDYGYMSDPLPGILLDTETFEGMWGGGTTAGSGGIGRVVLFDVPRSPLLSLGALQHANLGRYTFDPSYIVGNSFPPSRLADPSQPYRTDYSSSGQDFWDLSYLVNQQLWDSYYFSGIPKNLTAANLEDLLDGTASLPNHRLRVISSTTAPTIDDLTSTAAADDTFYRVASHLAVDGAFNINSTSSEAWQAILASSKDLSIPDYGLNGSKTPTGFRTESNAAFSRLINPVDDSGQFWSGYRTLDDDAIRELADTIVDLIQERGQPFSSLAEFVNRPLRAATGGQAAAGLLQEALNICQARANPDTSGNGHDLTAAPKASGVTYDPYEGYEAGTAFPGDLTQADILQALGPVFTARSDTFTIRSYGDVLNPLNGAVESQAWCEAVVQRMPDETLDNADTLSRTANRKFRIVSFRWLTKDEV